MPFNWIEYKDAKEPYFSKTQTSKVYWTLSLSQIPHTRTSAERNRAEEPDSSFTEDGSWVSGNLRVSVQMAVDHSKSQISWVSIIFKRGKPICRNPQFHIKTLTLFFPCSIESLKFFLDVQESFCKQELTKKKPEKCSHHTKKKHCQANKAEEDTFLQNFSCF